MTSAFLSSRTFVWHTEQGAGAICCLQFALLHKMEDDAAETQQTFHCRHRLCAARHVDWKAKGQLNRHERGCARHCVDNTGCPACDDWMADRTGQRAKALSHNQYFCRHKDSGCGWSRISFSGISARSKHETNAFHDCVAGCSRCAKVCIFYVSNVIPATGKRDWTGAPSGSSRNCQNRAVESRSFYMQHLWQKFAGGYEWLANNG